jgi:hypothetical protein
MTTKRGRSIDSQLRRRVSIPAGHHRWGSAEIVDDAIQVRDNAVAQDGPRVIVVLIPGAERVLAGPRHRLREIAAGRLQRMWRVAVSVLANHGVTLVATPSGCDLLTICDREVVVIAGDCVQRHARQRSAWRVCACTGQRAVGRWRRPAARRHGARQRQRPMTVSSAGAGRRGALCYAPLVFRYSRRAHACPDCQLAEPLHDSRPCSRIAPGACTCTPVRAGSA